MDARTEKKEKRNEDYQWLIKDATWGEFWFALDTVVDWIKKREQINKPRDEKQNK